MSRTTVARTYAAFAGCCATWGSTFLAIRIGNDTVPPIWAATLRLTLASGILALLAWITGQRLPRGPGLQAALGYGFLVFGVNFALLYWGEKSVPSGTTAVLYATIPLSTALFARLFGLERLDPLKLGGALLALAGVATLFSGELGAKIAAVPLLAIVAGTLSASLGSVLLKRGPTHSALVANAVGSAIGAVVCLVLSTIAGEPKAWPRTRAEWFPILYLTLAGSIFAFVLWAWLLKHWTATRASTISVVVPIVAVILGAIVRSERLSSGGLFGTILVIAGVFLAFRSRGDRPASRYSNSGR